MEIISTLRALLAEALATMFFVYFSVGSVAAAGEQTEGSDVPLPVINYACSFGFTITCLAYAIADLSGAHINPAVSLALGITLNMSPITCLLYMLAQFLGGLVGGALIRASVSERNYISGIAINPEIDIGQAFFFEFMGTLFLLFTVFFTAAWSANPKKDDIAGNTFGQLAPIPIGLSVLVAHLTVGPFTGCGINPARALGAVVYEHNFFDSRAGKSFWLYFIAPWCASLCAPLIYFLAYGTFKAGAMVKKQEAEEEVADGTTTASKK